MISNYKSNNRSNSGLEILRIVFLLFLLITHYTDLWKNLNTIDFRIIAHLSHISVGGFLAITGLFVYQKPSFFLRNISRLIFVIIISLIIGFALFNNINHPVNFDKKSFYNFFHVISGGKSSWYLWAILPVYFFAPLLGRFLKRCQSSFAPLYLALGSALMYLATQFLLPLEGDSFFPNPFLQILTHVWLMFAITFGSYYLKSLIDQNPKWIYLFWIIGNLSIIALSTAGAVDNLIFNSILRVGGVNEHLGISLVFLVYIYCKNFQSSKVNWFIKRAYFIYEYHWYWQALYAYLFGSFITLHPHANFYVYILVGGAWSLIASWFISEIQFHLWNRFTDSFFEKIAQKTRIPFQPKSE